jgi:malic enzyme
MRCDALILGACLRSLCSIGGDSDSKWVDEQQMQSVECNFVSTPEIRHFYIYPAMGLAVFATEAKRVPDELFIEAAKASAAQVEPEELARGMLFPPQKDIAE